MSTRCQIGFYQEKPKNIEKFEALLYRHSDGYPSGVLPDIMPFLAWWSKGRGISDSEYVSARLLQYLCNKYDKYSIEWTRKSLGKDQVSDEYREGKKQEIADTIEYTGQLGHGISKYFHGDLEYYYAVTTHGVIVYAVEGLDDNDSLKVKELGTIPYTDYEDNTDYKKLTKDESGEVAY